MDVTVIIYHLPVLLNQLMWLIIRVNNDEVSLNIIKVLIHIVHQLHEVNKSHILNSYLQVLRLRQSVTSSKIFSN